MMIWAPKRENRAAIKFWLECAQALTIVVAVAGAILTYYWHYETRERELSKAFEEKKLTFYTDAARVLARLSAPGPALIEDENQFWELYFGELPFVQSTGPGSVSEAMNAFCVKKFRPERCSLKSDEKVRPAGSLEALAIDMSQRASREIRSKWLTTAK